MNTKKTMPTQRQIICPNMFLMEFKQFCRQQSHVFSIEHAAIAVFLSSFAV